MPEAAVNEEYQLKFGKDKVRSAKEFGVSAPASDAAAPKQLDHREFRRLVAATPNTRHEAGPLCSRQKVRYVLLFRCIFEVRDLCTPAVIAHRGVEAIRLQLSRLARGSDRCRVQFVERVVA